MGVKIDLKPGTDRSIYGHIYDKNIHTADGCVVVDTYSDQQDTQVYHEPTSNQKTVIVKPPYKPIDYNLADNKPCINGVTLIGNVSGEDLGLGGPGGGTTWHDKLKHLDYASSGHTGFQPAGNYIEDINYVHTDNNYTTLDKDKLATIEEGANHYILPDTVVKDESYIHTDNNFTDAEKNKLNTIEEHANYYTLPSSVVQDESYVHTDNNFTDNYKNKIDDMQNTTIDGLTIQYSPKIDASTRIGTVVVSSPDVVLQTLYINADVSETDLLQIANSIDFNGSGTVPGMNLYGLFGCIGEDGNVGGLLYGNLEPLTEMPITDSLFIGVEDTYIIVCKPIVFQGQQIAPGVYNTSFRKQSGIIEVSVGYPGVTSLPELGFTTVGGQNEKFTAVLSMNEEFMTPEPQEEGLVLVQDNTIISPQEDRVALKTVNGNKIIGVGDVKLDWSQQTLTIEADSLNTEGELSLAEIEFLNADRNRTISVKEKETGSIYNFTYTGSFSHGVYCYTSTLSLLGLSTIELVFCYMDTGYWAVSPMTGSGIITLTPAAYDRVNVLVWSQSFKDAATASTTKLDLNGEIYHYASTITNADNQEVKYHIFLTTKYALAGGVDNYKQNISPIYTDKIESAIIVHGPGSKNPYVWRHYSNWNAGQEV